MLAELTSRLPEKDFFPDGTQLAGLRLLEKDFLPEMEITGKQFKKLHGKRQLLLDSVQVRLLEYIMSSL